jgi:hypothetical protein
MQFLHITIRRDSKSPSAFHNYGALELLNVISTDATHSTWGHLSTPVTAEISNVNK